MGLNACKHTGECFRILSYWVDNDMHMLVNINSVGWPSSWNVGSQLFWGLSHFLSLVLKSQNCLINYSTDFSNLYGKVYWSQNVLTPMVWQPSLFPQWESLQFIRWRIKHSQVNVHINWSNLTKDNLVVVSLKDTVSIWLNLQNLLGNKKHNI